MGFVEQTAARNLTTCHQIDSGLREQAESGCRQVQVGSGGFRWVEAGRWFESRQDLSPLAPASPPKRPVLPQLPESPLPFQPWSNEPTVDPIDFLSLHTAACCHLVVCHVLSCLFVLIEADGISFPSIELTVCFHITKGSLGYLSSMYFSIFSTGGWVSPLPHSIPPWSVKFSLIPFAHSSSVTSSSPNNWLQPLFITSFVYFSCFLCIAVTVALLHTFPSSFSLFSVILFVRQASSSVPFLIQFLSMYLWIYLLPINVCKVHPDDFATLACLAP